jgi:hypothetical protein
MKLHVPQRNFMCRSASVGIGHARQSLPLRRQRDEITLQPDHLGRDRIAI